MHSRQRTQCADVLLAHVCILDLEVNRLLNEKLLADEKMARFPVQHESFRPNLSLTTQDLCPHHSINKWHILFEPSPVSSHFMNCSSTVRHYKIPSYSIHVVKGWPPDLFIWTPGMLWGSKIQGISSSRHVRLERGREARGRRWCLFGVSVDSCVMWLTEFAWSKSSKTWTIQSGLENKPRVSVLNL